MGEGGCSGQLQLRDQPQSLGDVTMVYGPSSAPGGGSWDVRVGM